MFVDGGSGGCGIECINGLNMNDCFVFCFLEVLLILVMGFESLLLKKGGIGNVFVVGDGFDCVLEYEKIDVWLWGY